MVIELPVAPVVSIVPDLKGGFGMGIFGFVEAELKKALPLPKRKKGLALLARNLSAEISAVVALTSSPLTASSEPSNSAEHT